METCHFILATAGHVDHGKSALVKALTGIDPDRLPEEKARGITIDLGFAHLELEASRSSAGVPPARAESSPSRSNTADAPPHDSQAGRLRYCVGIVDVPGHEDFVKNMVAGVGSIDAALFVVAADDGWMPQSEEHLQILSYLGVSRAVVALTKIDLIEPAREAAVIAGVRAQLRDSPLAKAEVVPTSTVGGRGFEELKAALARVLATAPPPRDFGKPRLPIDRVFTLHGIGTIVTGTLNGGTLLRGQEVVIQPSGRATRIRSLQSHNCEVEFSAPGTRTALNLPDAQADQVSRGEVVMLPGSGLPSDTLDVLLEKSVRLADHRDAAARPLKDGALVRVHHGSGNFTARVCFLKSGARSLATEVNQNPPEPPATGRIEGELAPGQRALAQLRAEAPVFTFVGDRFIVRDWAEQATLAGGVVLDASGDRRRFRSEAQRRFLEQRAVAPDDLAVLVTSQLARDGAVATTLFLAKSRFSADEIQRAIQALVAEGRDVLVGGWIVDAGLWKRLIGMASEAVEVEHRAHPERPGIALSDLRAALSLALPAMELFVLLVADLCRQDFTQVGSFLRRASHRPALPAQLQAAGGKLRAALGANPFDPPTRKALATDPATHAALRFLLQTGEAVELSDETILLAENLARATEIIRRFLRERGFATASELRQSLGTSRRVIIPILERLDREGITRREGDRRRLRGPQ